LALNAISDGQTSGALTAERAFLAELEGSCRTPIAGLARLEGGRLKLVGEVLRTDGSERFDVAVEGAPADAERLGREAGRDLKCRLPEGVLVKGG
jgi:hydroxymethylbilane synthase